MTAEILKKVLQTDYFSTFESHLFAIYNKTLIVGTESAKSPMLKLIKHMEAQKYTYNILQEISENIAVLDPIQIPHFYKKLKKEVSRFEYSIKDPGFGSFSSSYIKQYREFVEDLDENYYLSMKAAIKDPEQAKSKGEFPKQNNKKLSLQCSQPEAIIVFQYLLDSLKAIKDKRKRGMFIQFLTGFSGEIIRKDTSGQADIFNTAKGENRRTEVNRIIEQLNSIGLTDLAEKIKLESKT